MQSGWKQRQHKNLEFVWYEDLKKDSTAVISDLCQFLGYPMSTEKIQQLAKHVSIDNMREQESVDS